MHTAPAAASSVPPTLRRVNRSRPAAHARAAVHMGMAGCMDAAAATPAASMPWM